jgi:CHAD domain-containing protein
MRSTDSQPSSEKIIPSLTRLAAKLRDEGSPKSVHKLRTTLRRLQALLSFSNGKEELPPQLEKLRKQAGRVRSLDVQIAALAGVNVGRSREAKDSVRQHLEAQRDRRIAKLQKQLAAERFPKLRKQLKTIASEIENGKTAKIDAGQALRRAHQLWKKTQQRFRVHEPNGLTEQNLHELRLACKTVRYTAEFAEGNADAKHLIDGMKQIQDAVGEWHDWVELTEVARKVLGESRLPLIAALENFTRAKFAHAKRTVTSVAAQTVDAAERKSPQPVPASRSAAAQRA